MNRLLHKSLGLLLGLSLILLTPVLSEAQITRLNGSADKIQVVLAGAKSTVDATVHVDWTGEGGPASVSKSTNGVTAVDLLTGEDAKPPRTVNGIMISNTDTAAITLTLRKVTGGSTFSLVNAVTLQPNDTLKWSQDWFGVTDSSGNTRGTANASFVRTGQTFKVASHPKVGTTAGWTVGAANNLGTIATVAASQTSATLVVRIDGLHVGDTITGIGVFSSINSVGGAVTLDCALRKTTIAAGATATDAAVTGGAITQVSVTAATASSATKTGITEVVASGTSYYLLLTATTAASTTIELDALEVTVTSS